jgi:hypothetical protein
MVKQDDNPEYTGNESWSDLTKSMDSHHVKKRASMDSDITILTNDSSSIAVISESSIETLAEEIITLPEKQNKISIMILNTVKPVCSSSI